MNNTTFKTFKLPIITETIGITKEISVFHYKNNNSSKKIYLQAGLHADEFPGILVLNNLLSLLKKAYVDNLIIGEIIIVPYANPIGMGQSIKGSLVGRFDFGMTGNFNRDFLDLSQININDENLTNCINKNTNIILTKFKEQLDSHSPLLEADHLKKILLSLSFDSDYVLDLHCDTNSTLHIYANKRQQDIAKKLAKRINSPIVLLEDNPGGNSFDFANSSPWWTLADKLKKPVTNNCFSATIELRGQQDINEIIIKQDTENIYQFLQDISIIKNIELKEKSDISNTIDDNITITELNSVDTVTSPVAGLVIFNKNLGEFIKKGEVIANIIDFSKEENNKTELIANTDGILFTKTNCHLTKPGHTIAKIAGNKPLTYRSGNLLGF